MRQPFEGQVLKYQVYGFALKYCFGQGMSTPRRYAARSGQSGCDRLPPRLQQRRHIRQGDVA
jgi:hypothetical protein